MSAPNPPAPEADCTATHIAGRCRSLLEERATGDQITTETAVWGDGSLQAKAFHTVWHSDRDDGFAREVVSYHSGPHPHRDTGRFVFAVRHYHTGHHETFREYVLEEIDDE